MIRTHLILLLHGAAVGAAGAVSVGIVAVGKAVGVAVIIVIVVVVESAIVVVVVVVMMVLMMRVMM